MDLEAVLVGLAVPPETYTAIDTSLGARLETPRLVCAGDSLTDGSHGGGNCSIPATLEYPSQLQLLRPKRFVINSGNWGARIGSLLPVDQYFTDGGQLVVFAGSNDVTGGSPAEAIVRELSAYCRTRREKGWKVYVCTLLPRSFVGGTNPPKDFEEGGRRSTRRCAKRTRSSPTGWWILARTNGSDRRARNRMPPITRRIWST
jgi:lysophospholipase L1-like esterase